MSIEIFIVAKLLYFKKYGITQNYAQNYPNRKDNFSSIKKPINKIKLNINLHTKDAEDNIRTLNNKIV